MSDNVYLSNTTQPITTWNDNTADSGSITINTPTYTIDPNVYGWNWVQAPGYVVPNNKKGDDDMRYLYEVILVNPKNDKFEFFHKVARSEVCALMYAYEGSKFNSIIAFDDLKTSCRILMEWKKEYPKTAVE